MRTPSYHHTYFTKAVAQLCQGDDAAVRESLLQGLGYAPGYSAMIYARGVRQFGLSLSDPLLEKLVALWPSC